MLLYRCSGVGSIPKITIVKRWTASAWSTYEYNGQSSSDQRNKGSETFTIPSDGLYLFVWGGNPLRMSTDVANGSYDSFGPPNGWATVGSSVSAYTLRPKENQPFPINGIPTVYIKNCIAGETYTFSWSVSRWNKIGGTVANLILIEI